MVEPNYRQWQARNTEKFTSLSNRQQQQLRERGYYNVGWEKVRKSWELICSLTNKVTNIFDRQLQKGNLLDAINLSILEADRAKQMATTGLNILHEKSKQITDRANQVLDKYQPL